MTLKELKEAQKRDLLKVQEIVDKAKAEKRDLNKDELSETQKLTREIKNRELEMLRFRNDHLMEEPRTSREVGFQNWIRSIARDNNSREGVTLQREVTMVSTDAAPMIPLAINDIVQPLEEGLILGKVGLKVQTGLQGNYVWPTVAAVEGEFAGENVELSDKTIAIDKIVPSPYRVGITMSVTNQLINTTAGMAYQVVQQQIPQAVTRVLNKAMFSPDTINAGKVNGPFVACKAVAAAAMTTLTTTAKRKAARHITFSGALPTYKELLAMKGIVLCNGIINDGTMCYVMDEYTKALLESTPRDAGSGLMVVENGMIAGVPVFTTNYINNDGALHIGLGVWSYEALGQFGDMRFIVDPYTKAKNDAVQLTLNGDWSMTTLRLEAFTLGDCTVA